MLHTLAAGCIRRTVHCFGATLAAQCSAPACTTATLLLLKSHHIGAGATIAAEQASRSWLAVSRRHAHDGALREKKYVDRITIEVKGGSGGNGCSSFYKSISKGQHRIPDGGNGGPGGNVYLQASKRTKSLGGIKQLVAARNGAHGGKQGKRGSAGRDVVVPVPLGTTVRRLADLRQQRLAAASGAAVVADGAHAAHGGGPEAACAGGAVWELQDAELGDMDAQRAAYAAAWGQPWDGERDYASSEDEEDGGAALRSGAGAGAAAAGALVCDLAEEGQAALVAAGGLGGRGNATMRGRQYRAGPEEADPGKSGEYYKLLLEIRSMADVGLIGLPNVGKSSLLRALSAAQPAVGDYAFTTLRPQLGVVEYADGSQLTVADVPGLLPGAHANVGLGHAFLRHVERARCLAFVLDVSAGLPARSCEGLPPPDPAPRPCETLAMLRRELRMYDPGLLARPSLVIANKMDLLLSPHASQHESLAALCQTVEEIGAAEGTSPMPVVAVSATERRGLTQLAHQLRLLAPTDMPL